MINLIGKKCILRGDRSGVFFGEIVNINETIVEVKNVRKIYKWIGANCIEQLSTHGVKDQINSKFTVVVKQMIITDILQILPCTNESIDNLEGVAEWRITHD